MKWIRRQFEEHPTRTIIALVIVAGCLTLGIFVAVN